MEQEGENVNEGVVEEKSEFSHDVSRELEMPSPQHFKVYRRMFHCNLVKYWK
jgi:hypothetical protein